MLVVDKKYRHLKWRHIHFVDQRQSQLEKGIDIVHYEMYTDDMVAVTLISDLSCDEDVMLSKIKKNTKYEIRRAEKEGVIYKYYDSSILPQKLNELIEFYNDFVDTKEELTFRLSYEYIYPYIQENAIFFSVAYYEEQLVVLHVYYGDGDTIRLWYSASHFRDMTDVEKRNYIGRANRFLHWKDMLYFKEKGYTKYDWGGFSLEPDRKTISEFKLAFGGEKQGVKTGVIVPISVRGKIAWTIRNWIR